MAMTTRSSISVKRAKGMPLGGRPRHRTLLSSEEDDEFTDLTIQLQA